MKKYLKINKKAYDLSAKEYSYKDLFGGNNYLFYQPWIDMIFSVFNLSKNHTALELGAGTGQFLKILEDNNFSTTAIEFSNEMIKYIKKNSPNTKVINKNILEVTLNEKFDLIVAMAFIHCFDEEDLIEILKKINKWLKNDGFFAICTTIHNKTDEGYFEKKDYDNNKLRFRKKWSKSDLEELLNKNNYKIIKEFYHSEITKPKSWISYLIKKDLEVKK